MLIYNEKRKPLSIKKNIQEKEKRYSLSQKFIILKSYNKKFPYRKRLKKWKKNQKKKKIYNKN